MMSYKCFTNKDCQYYPCHTLPEGETFNCMFCYCPLYALGDRCGGDFVYSSSGIKDCSACIKPHCGEQGWEHVRQHVGELVLKMRNLKEIKRPSGLDNNDKLIC